ncbi:MAG: hypothetical protein AB1861_13915, partial [Cyanobacteriota bacterium]
MKRTIPTLLGYSFLAAGVAIASSAFSPAHAASMTFSAYDFTNRDVDAKVNFTLDDTAAGVGKIQFKVDVDNSVSFGDIRGIFFNILDDTLLSGLKISGADVTATAFGPAGTLNSVGSSSNTLEGGGKTASHYFDAGVEIGQEGIGGNKGDIQSTIFTLSHSSVTLTLAQFYDQKFGVRLMSVGDTNDEKSRQESSKLIGTAPKAPIPSGGTTSGDTTSGDTTSGGTTSGGTTSGGTTSDGTTSDGTTSGGTTSGDTTSGGTTTSGSTTSGSTTSGGTTGVDYSNGG